MNHTSLSTLTYGFSQEYSPRPTNNNPSQEGMCKCLMLNTKKYLESKTFRGHDNHMPIKLFLETYIYRQTFYNILLKDWIVDHNPVGDGEHLQLSAYEHPGRGGWSNSSCCLDCKLHHLCLSFLALICLHTCQAETDQNKGNFSYAEN